MFKKIAIVLIIIISSFSLSGCKSLFDALNFNRDVLPPGYSDNADDINNDYKYEKNYLSKERFGEIAEYTKSVIGDNCDEEILYSWSGHDYFHLDSGRYISSFARQIKILGEAGTNENAFAVYKESIPGDSFEKEQFFYQDGFSIEDIKYTTDDYYDTIGDSGQQIIAKGSIMVDLVGNLNENLVSIDRDWQNGKPVTLINSTISLGNILGLVRINPDSFAAAEENFKRCDITFELFENRISSFNISIVLNNLTLKIEVKTKSLGITEIESPAIFRTSSAYSYYVNKTAKILSTQGFNYNAEANITDNTFSGWGAKKYNISSQGGPRNPIMILLLPEIEVRLSAAGMYEFKNNVEKKLSSNTGEYRDYQKYFESIVSELENLKKYNFTDYLLSEEQGIYKLEFEYAGDNLNEKFHYYIDKSTKNLVEYNYSYSWSGEVKKTSHIKFS